MDTIKPALARIEAKPWNKPNWIWETKFDGVRAIVDTKNGEIQSRSGKNKSANFPEIRPRTVLPAILDGEIVAYANGKTDFNTIQHRGTTGDIAFRQSQYPVHYEVFDVLSVDGNPVTSYPLSERKKLLETILIPDDRVHLTPYSNDGEALFAAAVANEMEGVIGKDLNQKYMFNAREWVKVKRSQIENFFVCGYTAGTGWRKDTFGALVLAKTSQLVSGVAALTHVGEVGTGFNDQQITQIHQILGQAPGPCPFTVNPYTAGNQPTWVVPVLQIIVRFLEYTNDGKLRFPAFKGIVK